MPDFVDAGDVKYEAVKLATGDVVLRCTRADGTATADVVGIRADGFGIANYMTAETATALGLQQATSGTIAFPG